MTSRRRFVVAVAVLGVLSGVAAPRVVAAPDRGNRGLPRAVSAATHPTMAAPARVRGVPRGAPRAAREPEPRLPEPSHRAWPFPSAFPRTSGTGRLAGGASLWSDWLFDDHGAAGPAGLPVSTAATVSLLAPAQGAAGYPAGPARGNGADIFRAAVGVTRRASYWRVDWTTLLDAKVPIAEWTFDTDDNPRTGGSVWPAAAGVHSPGIETALVVSAGHAELIDVRSGKSSDVVAHGGRLVVDRSARSFVVRVPHRLLPVGGDWRVRLAGGLAAPGGRSFAPADFSGSSNALDAASLPRVYNVTFRSRRQEPPVYTDGSTDARIAQLQGLLAAVPPDAALGLDGAARAITGNFWMEDHQADVLGAGGNVGAFSRVIDWARLASQVRTPQPRPRGFSDRWYVSRLHLGQGVVRDRSAAGDLLPNYLSRVQPYAVYVPRHVSLARPTKLTWILHSLSVNLNQYGALDPQLLREACQQRRSICATTEGFGPDGWYFDEAEQDFWSVWHALAGAYRLDPGHTVLAGYSMGGWAAYKLGLEHPDLFSEAMALEGPPDCGIRIVELPNGKQVTASAGAGHTGRCGADGSSTPLLGNARWLPYVITQGVADELVPLPSNLQTAADLSRLGERYTLFRLPAEDHLVYALQDRFAGVVAALGKAPAVVRNPGRIDFSWYPNLTDRALGIGTTTAYWLSGLRSTTHSPGAVASVHADSAGIAARSITSVRRGPTLVATPPIALRSSLTWHRGPRRTRHDRLRLSLRSVAALTVDTGRARLRCPAVTVSTDSPVQLSLTRLRPGSRAHYRGRESRAGRHGHLVLRLPRGLSRVSMACSERPVSAASGGH